ncbi:WXG100 family type VII secretion target [Nocardia sp. KC 131]|uniref:WXG100 family type VII secretion target n=1 Tax=Nocardia arseniciresistens TaxID=3392119 RepID=UPI00398E9B41
MSENERKQIPGDGEDVLSWTHGEINDAFEGVNVDPTFKAALDFSNAATNWDQGLETFARSITNSISQAWEGAAAEKAKDAIERYTDDARKLEPLLTRLSNQIAESASAIVDTKKAIPGYRRHSWTANVWPPRAAEEERARNDAEAEAQNAMDTNYRARLGEHDAQIPVLPVGQDPTRPLDIPASKPGDNPN